MKYAAYGIPWMRVRDRFMAGGYHKDEELNYIQILERIAQVPGVDGVELNYFNNVTEKNVAEIKAKLAELNLGVSCVGAPVSGEPQWTWGTLTSPKKESRDMAIERVKATMDIAYELKTKNINLWVAQDGYDYPLEMDYAEAYDMLIDGIKQIAKHRSDINVCLEYKINEPRKQILNTNIGKALYLSNKVNMNNVGVLLDFGHAYQARENPAESAYLAAREGKLFHVHVNDNRGYDDDDFMAGAVHFFEYIDFVYWLKKTNYDGWLGLDIFPIRENGARAVKNTITFMKGIESLVEKIGMDELKKASENRDVTGLYELVWDILFNFKS